MADIGTSIYKGLVFFSNRNLLIPFLLMFAVSLVYTLLPLQIPTPSLNGTFLLNFAYLLGVSIVIGLISLYLTCLIIILYPQGNKLSIKKAAVLAAKKYVNFVIASILLIVFVVLGFFALIIPGIYVAIKLLFTQQEVVINRLKPMDALRRSWAITDGRFWEIFGFLLVILIISVVIYFFIWAISLTTYLIPQPNIGTAVSNIILSLTSAFLSVFSLCAITQFFLDLDTGAITPIFPAQISATHKGGETTHIIRRSGQIIGKEKKFCEYCKKETNHWVVYFLAKKWTWLLLGAISYTILGDAHVAYICTRCSYYTRPKNQNELKHKYGWSNWSGFKAPKETIEFKLRKRALL